MYKYENEINKDYGLDMLERRSVQVGDTAVTLQKKIPFWSWIEQKWGTKREFLRLSRQEKIKKFYQWKHGYSSHDSNMAIETTNRGLRERYKRPEFSAADLSKADRFLYHLEEDFENKCSAFLREMNIDHNKIDTNQPGQISKEANQLNNIVKKQIEAWEE